MTSFVGSPGLLCATGNGFFCYTQLCYKMLTHGLMNNYLLARGFIRLSEHLVFCALQEIDSFVIPTCDKMLTHGLMNIWWLGGGGIFYGNIWSFVSYRKWGILLYLPVIKCLNSE